jgi:hypothetical protein
MRNSGSLSPGFPSVALPITRSGLLLRPVADPERELRLVLFPPMTWLVVRGSGSNDMTSGVAHSHVALAIASSPTARATAYAERGARELGGAVVFSPKRKRCSHSSHDPALPI